MAHTQAWNATFEALPANNDDASEGAERIRNLKRDIRERLAVDHEMELAANSTTADGRHKKVTLVQQDSEPTNAASTGFLYTYNNAGSADLHYMDNNGSTVRITEGSALAHRQYHDFTQQDNEPTNASSHGYLYIYNFKGVAELHWMDENGATTRMQSPHVALPGFNSRAKFEWIDSNEVTVGAACYHHHGTVEQYVYWDTDLRYKFTNLTTSGWTYLYLDDSAIVTAKSDNIGTGQFIDSTTAPTRSRTKHGHYNGEDKCIFAVYSGADSAIVEFDHEGGFLEFGDDQGASNRTPTAVWGDGPGPMIKPSFTNLVEVNFYTEEGTDTTTILYWRPKGNTATVGHIFTKFGAENLNSYDYGAGQIKVVTDDNGYIETKNTGYDNKVLYMSTVGWYFPTGM